MTLQEGTDSAYAVGTTKVAMRQSRAEADLVKVAVAVRAVGVRLDGLAFGR